MSSETKLKISISMLKRNPKNIIIIDKNRYIDVIDFDLLFMVSDKRKLLPVWNKGLTKETDERVRKYSESQIGKIKPIEVRIKISNSIRNLPPEIWDKILFHVKGKHRSNETKRKISETYKNMSPERKAEIRTRHNYGKGKNAHGWKGGISYEPYCPRFNKELKERIRAFFDYRCILCGKTENENNEKLSCHHVEYNKQACCDGKPVCFATLCRSCHSKTNGGDNNRNKWMNMIRIIITEIYSGRSYYTEAEWKIIQELDM